MEGGEITFYGDSLLALANLNEFSWASFVVCCDNSQWPHTYAPRRCNSMEIQTSSYRFFRLLFLIVRLTIAFNRLTILLTISRGKTHRKILLIRNSIPLVRKLLYSSQQFKMFLKWKHCSNNMFFCRCACSKTNSVREICVCVLLLLVQQDLLKQ